jgi:6-phosphofructokinase
MNAATRVLARVCHSRGHTPLGIRNGFSGLVNDEVDILHWEDVRGWQTIGGSQLGTNRDHPTPIPGITSISKPRGVDALVDTGAIAFHLQKHNIHALVMIGGFEAFSAQLTLTEARKVYPALCIPMVHISATISNNMPGTDYSIGSDTALNVIVGACDSIRLSANASRKRVFVVEVHGGNCGFLSTLSALTVGATASYIPEEGLSMDLLQSDVKYLVRRYTEEIQAGIPNEGRVILRSESAEPAVYSTSFISGMLRAEGKGLFDSRETVLGHLQQGDTPSPLDRIRATRLAVKTVDWIQKVLGEVGNSESQPFPTYTQDDNHSVVMGIRGATLVPTPVKVAQAESDMSKRTVRQPWWTHLRSVITVLGRHGGSSKL